jgi:hypothetical protein
MATENQEKSFGQEALEKVVGLTTTLFDAFKGIDGLGNTKLTQFTVGKSGAGATIIIDYFNNDHTWDQIAGKLFGMAIDVASAKKLRNIFEWKPTTTGTQYFDNFGQGFAVFTFEEFTDFSAADYFEKAFPAARQFAQTLYDDVVNGDGIYARQIWEGIKATADTDLIRNYYSTVTMEQWFSDFRELFDPSYTPPTINNPSINIYAKNNEGSHLAVDFNNGNEDTEKGIVKEAIKHNQLTKLTLNNQTYDITKENDLAVRNAIDNIPKVSFLLSHILIKTGEILDIGEYGLYEVKSGDTMSQIAERYGFTT